jgi:hypothetical protein
MSNFAYGMYIYYIYMYVCTCSCVCSNNTDFDQRVITLKVPVRLVELKKDLNFKSIGL